MALNGSAEENLKVIRSLMERATVYRAVSVPTAAWGGALSLGGCALAFAGRLPFLAVWIAIFLFTAALNAVFIRREAGREGRAFFSPALRTAWLALLPVFLVAAVVTACGLGKDPVSASVFWILLYGVALLATQQFAPRSLVALGWAFLLTGLVLFAAFNLFDLDAALPGSGERLASVLMAATFGLYHLAYALLVHLSLCRERAARIVNGT